MIAKTVYRVQANCHISDIRAGLGVDPEFRPIAISAMQNSAGLGSVLVIQPTHYKNIHRKKHLNNGY